MKTPSLVLVDTNVIIEAVRTGCWAGITGRLTLESVEACRNETLAGSADTIPGYVAVTRDDIGRLFAVHSVDDVTRAAFKLAYADADGMDPGEHDLVAHACSLPEQDWVLCSPDKASIRAAVALGFGDQVSSLEDLARAVGARPAPPLRRQYTSAWLSSFRTKVVLEGM